MARLITSGGEIHVGIDASPATGQIIDGLPTTSPPSTLTKSTTTKRSGLASFRLTSSGGGFALVDIGMTGANERSYWGRAYVMIGTAPNIAMRLLVLTTQTSFSNVQLNTDGTVSASLSAAVKSPPINDGNWHRVEYFWKLSATQANRAWELRVDGATISSGSNQATVDAVAPNGFEIGTPSPTTNYDIYVDDIAVNDSTGTANNTWCGPGAVVLLVPTADSAVGAGWTNDNAATSNLFNSVKNTPPLGIADTTSGGGGHQIRNATSNANSSYDATMTTYAAAGVGPTDIVNAVVPFVITAASSLTTPKAGTVGVVSNPAITNVSLDAGGTAGAFASSLPAVNIWQGWKGSAGTVTQAPAVTVGTAPVMRVTQVTANTQVAMVCFMGIYVDYTPAPPDPLAKTGAGVIG